MKLENQVCNLKLAQRLKELKVKQESYWSWLREPNGKGDFRLMNVNRPSGRTNLLAAGYDIFSAFTVAELGEILPDKIGISGLWFESIHERDGLFHSLDYRSESGSIFDIFPTPTLGNQAKTEANARAKMLIYLLENKLLTL